MRNRHRKNASLVARVIVRTTLLAAIFAVMVPVAIFDAHAAAPVTVSGSFAFATSSTNVSFATANSAVVTPDATTGQYTVAQSALAFTPTDVTLDNGVSFTVTLVPASDLAAMIDPTQGAALLGGQFTMQWQQDGAPGPACTVGPFAVQASTAPFGSSPYSSTTKALTVVDATPSVPDAQGCAFASLINDAAPLPVSPPATPAAANTAPLPAWTANLTFSAALPSPPTTTPPTKPPADPPAKTTPPPASTGSPAPPVAAASGAKEHAATSRTHVSTKSKTAKTTVTTPTTAPAPIDASMVPDQLPLDAVPPGLSSLNGSNATNNAIDPVPLGAKDSSSTTFVIGGLVLIILATAVALKLIGHDVRSLAPARAHARLDGPIAVPRLPAAPKRSIGGKN